MSEENKTTFSEELNKQDDTNDFDHLNFLNGGAIISFNSASTASMEVFSELEDQSKKIENRQDYQLLVKRVKRLEENFKYLQMRQNATDSFFIDELSSPKLSLTNVNIEKSESRIEVIQILLQENLNTLFEILELEDNWDQYGAKKFDPKLIFKCVDFVRKFDLDYQPEIFPSSQNSVHFEFKPDNDHYLGIIFFIDRIRLYKRIGITKNIDENISDDQALNEIKKFRQEFRNSEHRVSV